MRAEIGAFELRGTVRAIPSKSHVHRLLICAALGNAPVRIDCRGASNDIRATMNCLRALGAKGAHVMTGYGDGSLNEALTVFPIAANLPEKAELDPGESGSTYRFFTPLAAALGVETSFTLHGKLSSRPMDPLWNEMERHGVTIGGKGTEHPTLRGKLTPGEYRLPGNVSSQFFTGLLFALPLLEGDSRIAIEGKLESAGYIDMTLDALSLFGIKIERGEDYFAVPGGQKYNTPLDLYEALNEDYYSDADNAPTASPDPVWLPAEGDWSNSAFWLCAGATRGEIAVRGLSYPSLQGDSAVVEILRRFGADVKDEEVHYKEDSNAVKKETFHDFIGTLPGELLWNKKKDEDNGPGTQEFVPAAISVNAYYELEGITIDVSDIPDLVPALAVTAMAAKGRTTFTNAGRLRLKESDRIASVCAAVNALGGKAFAEGDSLIIEGGERPKGGTVDACGDHRIAMLAAVAAQWCSGPVTILGAEAVDKSYPNFWRDYASLGGYVTLYEEV